MPYPRFRFIGHPPTRQHLQAEAPFTFIETVGRWERGEVHAVIEDIAEMLRMTRCFEELPPEPATPPRPAPRAAKPAAVPAAEKPATRPAAAATSAAPRSTDTKES